jgi:lipid-binding SYLF domain-containing protein
MMLKTLAAGLAFLLAASSAQAETEQDALVEKARLTVESMAREQNLPIAEYLKRSKAVLIVPQFLKAGFIIGGAGGSGVLVARGQQGWSDPAFMTMGAGSIGLQIGAEAQEVLLMVMTDKGLDAILKDNVKLGGNASIAVGPVGAGASAATTTNLNADIVSFARSKGLYGGVSFEGAVVANRPEWNEAYYGRKLSGSEAIHARPSKAAALRQSLAKLGG